MSEDAFAVLLSFFKTLADESRLKILGVLAQRQASVEELSAMLGIKEPTVSHHLNRLKALDLVVMTRDGNRHLYRLHDQGLRGLSRSTLTGIAETAPRVDPAGWEAKVLATYLIDGRLTELPASRKKRWVVLAALAQQFPEGIDLPEKAVNEGLGQWHEDVATIRREFIGYRMMQRADGIYRRLPTSAWRQEVEA